MNPKDLLDFNKMAEFQKDIESKKKIAIKEDIKNNKPKENFSDLQKLNQDGDMYEYRPEEF